MMHLAYPKNNNNNWLFKHSYVCMCMQVKGEVEGHILTYIINLSSYLVVISVDCRLIILYIICLKSVCTK